MQDLGTLTVGTMSQTQLREALAGAGVQLNEHAGALMARREFMLSGPVSFVLVACSLRELGFPQGATLKGSYAAAASRPGR